MAKCMSCGKTALLTTNFGNVILCKNCGTLANVSAWNSREFESMNELMNLKNDAIQKATTANMSQGVIAEITRFFDEYINAGFTTSIVGKCGQTLKIFEDYCVVYTKSEGKKNELENMFYQFDRDDDDDDDDGEYLSSEDKRNLARGLMTGKIVQAGIGAAVNASLSKQEKEKLAEKRRRERDKLTERLISVGDRRINLRDIEGVEMYSAPNTANGYLKFVPKGVARDDIYNCEYFFFNNSIPFETKKIKQRLEVLKNIITDKIEALKREAQMVAEQAAQKKAEEQAAMQAEQMRKMVEEVTQQQKPDVFEEVRKFKQLFDEGIISEEEFNAKKKELLGL